MPCNKGSPPISGFKCQFIRVVSRNSCNYKEKVLKLIFILKGKVVKILAKMPEIRYQLQAGTT